MGAALTELGLSAQDRVVVVAGLGAEAAIAMLGAACVATCVPVSPSAGAELDAVLEETTSPGTAHPDREPEDRA